MKLKGKLKKEVDRAHKKLFKPTRKSRKVTRAIVEASTRNENKKVKK